MACGACNASQSCSINCSARDRTRSSSSSNATTNGSTDPISAWRTHLSRASRRTSMSGDLSAVAIQLGMTSLLFAGAEEVGARTGGVMTADGILLSLLEDGYAMDESAEEFGPQQTRPTRKLRHS